LDLSLRQFVDETLRGSCFGSEGGLDRQARIDGSNSEANGEAIGSVHGGTFGKVCAWKNAGLQD
jgi:hypothetical protein